MKGAVVNRCHLRLDVHSIEVMLTVPLKLEASVQVFKHFCSVFLSEVAIQKIAAKKVGYGKK